MSARVLVVGLDSCDPTLALALAREGRMPTLAKLLASSFVARTEPAPGPYVVSIWASFATGMRPEHHRYLSWSRFDAATYTERATSPDECEAPPFWEALSDADLRTAVLDVPRSRLSRGLNGMQLCEWATHDRDVGMRSWPPELAGEVLGRFGEGSVGSFDPYERRQFAPCDFAHGDPSRMRTNQELVALASDLRRTLAAKASASAYYLGSSEWDVFLTVFGESHCAGHQLWAQHEDVAARPDGRARDLLVEVYEQLDAALEKHLALAGDDATVLVFLTAGMDRIVTANHLLEPLLARLAADRTLHRSGLPVRAAKALWQRLPWPFRRRLSPLVAATARRRERQVAAEVVPSAMDRPFFAMSSNEGMGAIRLNLHGRESAGTVLDRDSTLDRLTDQLLDLVDVMNGEPAVERVVRSPTEVAARGYADLYAEWTGSQPIEVLYSPDAGLVAGATPSRIRTGNHRRHGLLVARGNLVRVDASQRTVPIEDLAPTIAALVGVDLDADGGVIEPMLEGDAARIS
ncbi:MAG: alkaline phosphatase family protein [Acidimicrobiia bacterium]